MHRDFLVMDVQLFSKSYGRGKKEQFIPHDADVMSVLVFLVVICLGVNAACLALGLIFYINKMI